jgi:hypothetical protein
VSPARGLVTGVAVLAALATSCTRIDVHLGGRSEANRAAAGPGGAGSAAGGAGGAPPAPGSCGLESPAFCETFDTPKPGGRGGALDEQRWSFARFGHVFQDFWVRIPAGTYPEDATHRFPATFCGQPFSDISPGEDVEICGGTGVDGSESSQLNEVFDDQGDFGMNSLQVRQPFDFSGRTGTIAWDVDAKVNPVGAGHGWWIAVWITEQPSPMPYYEEWKSLSYPRNGVGFVFATGADCASTEDAWLNALDTVRLVSDYVPRTLAFFDSGIEHAAKHCFAVADGRMNHLELRLSADRAELWASDHGDPSSFQLRDTIPNLGLSFSRGYVHFQHGQVDSSKSFATPSQTFRWDNIAFDGPVLPTPRAYDIPDNDVPRAGGVFLGWELSDGETQSYVFPSVDLGGAPGALLQLDLFSRRGQQLDFRFNDETWRSFVVDGATPDEVMGRGFAIPVARSDLRTGDNTLDLRMATPAPDVVESVANISLTLELEATPDR